MINVMNSFFDVMSKVSVVRDKKLWVGMIISDVVNSIRVSVNRVRFRLLGVCGLFFFVVGRDIRFISRIFVESSVNRVYMLC